MPYPVRLSHTSVMWKSSGAKEAIYENAVPCPEASCMRYQKNKLKIRPRRGQGEITYVQRSLLGQRMGSQRVSGQVIELPCAEKAPSRRLRKLSQSLLERGGFQMMAVLGTLATKSPTDVQSQGSTAKVMRLPLWACHSGNTAVCIESLLLSVLYLIC